MAWSRGSAKIKALGLDRFAEIFGLNAVAFNQGTYAPAASYGCSKCNEFWYQNAFQAGSNHITRDELTTAILSAERDLANFWGFPIVPEERSILLPYGGGCGPSLLAPSYVGHFSLLSHVPHRGHDSNVYLVNDYPIFGWGRQTLESQCSPQLQAYDQNDDLYTTKNLTDYPVVMRASCDIGTTTPGCEIEVYRGGHGGEREHLIREARVTNINGDLSIEIDPWYCIDHTRWLTPGDCGICLTAGTTPILDLLDPDVYIESVTVMRRFFDDTLSGAEFGWRGAPGCTCGSEGCLICELSYCPGCLIGGTHIVDGGVQVARARWDSDLEKWVEDLECQSCSRDPDFVKIYYWTGYNTGRDCLDTSEVEEIIALMAAARLPKSVCTCKCNQEYDRFREMQADMNYSDRNSGSYFISVDLVNNPFGTRRGEVDAYRKALAIKNRVPGGTVTTGAY